MNQRSAYTTARSDVCELVPSTARQILDIGCSNGALGLALLADRPERRITGIEYSPEYADEARTRLHRVFQGDAESFDWSRFAPDEFDCLIFADILEHLRQPERMLATALGHLRPGGHIVISMPNIRHISALSAIALGGSFPQRDRGIFDRTHLRWFTLADAKAMLAALDLNIEAQSFALRWGDRGGGRWNRLLGKLPPSLAGFGPIREFLCYQYCLLAGKPI